MIENILFDLDGTLTEPFEGITNSVLYALRKCGIEEGDRAKLKAFIGPPLVSSFSEFYGMTQEDVAHFASNVLATQQRLLGNNYVPLSEGEIETIYAARL